MQSCILHYMNQRFVIRSLVGITFLLSSVVSLLLNKGMEINNSGADDTRRIACPLVEKYYQYCWRQGKSVLHDVISEMINGTVLQWTTGRFSRCEDAGRLSRPTASRRRKGGRSLVLYPPRLKRQTPGVTDLGQLFRHVAGTRAAARPTAAIRSSPLLSTATLNCIPQLPPPPASVLQQSSTSNTTCTCPSIYNLTL